MGFTKLVYFPILITVFPGGAMVARIPVKDKVVGSNPTRGAEKKNRRQEAWSFLRRTRASVTRHPGSTAYSCE